MYKALILLAGVLISAGTLAQSGDPANGKAVYEHWCSPCHAPGARKHPGTAALEFLYKGEKPCSAGAASRPDADFGGNLCPQRGENHAAFSQDGNK